jgi:hypothetical protein
MSTRVHRITYTQQISVRELQEYWRTFETLEVDEGLEVIPLCFMPSWGDLCRELDWHSYRMTGGYFSKKEHAYCGVYRMIGLAADDDATKPATLNRVCGQDETGTLYIGRTRWLNERLNQLRRSLLSRHEDSHGAIGTLLEITKLKSRFPASRLAISILYTGIKPRFVEGTLIRAYMNTFGDTPPLNYST